MIWSLFIIATILSIPSRASVDKKVFGNLREQKVMIYTLTNKSGMEVQITEYGAGIVSIKVPDRNGKQENVVLRYPNLEGYINDSASVGSTVGRYANRIAGGKFTLNNKLYQLNLNNGPNTLHGGVKGFSKALWITKSVDQRDEPSVTLEHQSPHNDEGFPGTLNIQVRFSLTKDNELKITYSASTDQETVLNLTNHAYFNLSGKPNTPVLNHHLLINADFITPIDENMIPTGEIKSVDETLFDFRKSKAMKDHIDSDDGQIKRAGGYDHNWVLSKTDDGLFRLAARAVECRSGRTLEVWTTEPGIQFYSGNFLRGNFSRRSGFCLETQHFPDSPNHPHFPSTRLKAGQKFFSSTSYKFSVAAGQCP